ncbi:alpha/beta fold hydrolase [Phytohabitans houttuyneae]|uniref:Alpha/beta hydrolase n=1 Tax=Phytohabitans houttuyneae TaxID=1076126 RepID=A0A6V8KUM2_9ACTN|nr:alpha/beta hydrolase [Phytohabitans houttuyneae]GFJ85527.1 alpha/beta hydrolase [Phytohabitans houttuyneae]
MNQTVEQAEIRLSGGLRLHVRTAGPPDAAVTVVLLHGWVLDGRTWHRQVRPLAKVARVVTYDARGHGRSGGIDRRAATLDHLGDDLAEVLDAVAPDQPVVLAGHSLGGMTIMEYAHRHPAHFADRIAGLLLLSTTAEGHTHTVYGLPPRLAHLVRLAEMTSAHMLARMGDWRPHRALALALRPSLRWLLFGQPCDPADVQLTTKAVVRASLGSIGGFRPSVGAQARLETLAALPTVPTAVLVGERDRLTPPACSLSIAKALPGAALTICPDAGHMLMLERPDVVTAALLDLVEAAHDRRRRA